MKKLRDAIARRAQIEMELINHRKDGSRFHNRVLISRVYDENGHLSYFFASQFDVTLERDRLVRLQQEHDKLETEVKRRTRELACRRNSFVSRCAHGHSTSSTCA